MKALPVLLLSLGCSTVDRGDQGTPPAKDGELWCYEFPGAAAPDLDTEEMTEYPTTSEWCYCVLDPSNVGQTDMQDAFSFALADCISDADQYGLDPTQTNCGEVMQAPVHGDATGKLSCTLYGSGFGFIGDGQTEDGGDTGGEQSPEGSEPRLVAYPPIADANAGKIDWSGGGWPELVPLGCDLNRDCCELFTSDICRYTNPHRAMPGGAADWSVVDTTTDIDIAYRGCSVRPGPELVLQGRADFSVAACDDARCPIYLAALTLELPAETTGTFSTSLFDDHCTDKTIEHFELRLVHAALGSRDPINDRIAFPIGSLLFETAVDVSAMRGESGAGEYRFTAFNDRVVWGHASEDGQLSFERESLSFSEFGFELGVRFEADAVRPANPTSRAHIGPSR